jgi:peptide deformylase
VLAYPDPVLRRTAAPVARVDDGVRELAARLLATLAAHAGFGLAAPQIGVARRVVALNLHTRTLVLVNPVLVAARGESRSREGCLSLPGTPPLPVIRRAAVSVAYRDLDGTPRSHAASGHAAAILQHELDHLDGRLIIDYPPVA